MDKKKKATRKSSAPKIKDLNAEQRKLALIKQKQCDTIAFNIVGKLIDCAVEEDVFLQSLKYLNQGHYQDIVEERSLTKLCGYPICGNEVSDVPAKKFHISTKTNKVYDITERKNFCSNFCYKASIYIKEQMSTSPLWWRDQEEIPDFHLLPKTEIGIPGQEIDQGLLKLDVDEENFTSISKFTQDMINVMPEDVALNVEESTPIVSQEEKLVDTKKEEIKPESILEVNQKTVLNVPKIEPEKKSEFDMYFSNIIGPSLADILKENAEYFENQTFKNVTKAFDINKNPESKSKDNIKKLENISDKTENIKNNNKEFRIKINDKENKIETKTAINKISESNENIKNLDSKSRIAERQKKFEIESKKMLDKQAEEFSKDFNFKKIMEEHDKNITSKSYHDLMFGGQSQEISKGILKKSKEKKLEKKRVSFSSENSVKELLPNEITENRADTNKNFKKPEGSKKEENNGPRFKNTNLIGTVQERSSTYKFTNTEKETKKTEESATKKPKEYVEKYDNNSVTTAQNEQNKNKLQSNTQKNEQKNNSDVPENQESTKEKRLSRLKNSSAYKRANSLSTTTLQQKKFETYNLKSKLDTCISDWFTFDTVLFLYGEDQVKKFIEEKSFKQYLNKKKNLELDEKKQKQYDEICKRLNLMELTDQKFDESITGKKRRALPRYEDIRQQAEHMDLKVQAFYGGCHETSEEDGDTDTESMKDERDNGETPEGDEGQPAVLPLIDNKDVMATRRRIFHTCISRVIPNLCEILQESPNRLLSEIKHLINTFEFTATNIIFKSADWQFVTLLLIKILSIRDNDLQTTLATNDVVQYFSSLASQSGFQDKHIEEILSKLQLQNILHDSMRKDCQE